MSCTQSFTGTTNKNLATAVATLYINYAVLLTAGAPASESKTREQRAAAVLNAAVNLLNPNGDSETVYRALVAVGTLMSLGDEFRKEAAQAKDIAGLLKKIEGGSFRPGFALGAGFTIVCRSDEVRKTTFQYSSTSL